MSTEFKNNVTRLLESKRVPHQVYQYDYDAGVKSAVEVADAIGLARSQVFKTLVVMPDTPKSKPYLVVIPAPEQLELKTLAKEIGVKKVRMTSHEQAEALTGLQTGGISPLALLNKGFRVYLDVRARTFDTIAVSAGERGANVQLSVADLVRLTGARFVDL